MPDIRGKPTDGSQSKVDKLVASDRKLYAAYQKAQKKVQSTKKSLDNWSGATARAQSKLRDWNQKQKTHPSAYNRGRVSYWTRHLKADTRAKNRKQKAYNSAVQNLNKITKQKNQQLLADIKTAIADKGKWDNEGRMAIYPTDGGMSGAGSIVWFAATNTESESNSSNVTSWAVDKDAPRSSYIRISSRSISLDGIITGDTRAEAEQKWNHLQFWNENHNELTFAGDINYPHLFISALGRSYDGFRDNIKVTMTLTYVKFAEITDSNDQKHKKTSKSTKTTRGNRNKRYTAVTIKPGNTLWGFSQKYGKSVAWLAKVNHIKNPNLIYAGNKIRVR